MFIDNNISQGYKQTELGIIPEDWEVLSFSQVFDMYGHEIEMYTVEQGEKRDKRQ